MSESPHYKSNRVPYAIERRHADRNSKISAGGRQQFDSGFSETFVSIPMQVGTNSVGYDGGPPRPKLMGQDSLEDFENGDSGYMEDDSDIQKDCINTCHRPVPSQVSTASTATKVSPSQTTTAIQDPPLEPSVTLHVKPKKNAPRIPKRTVVASHSVSNSSVRTVTARSVSPKSVYSESHTTPRTHSTSLLTETHGPSSMTAIHNVPLTCDPFYMEHVRVPPVNQDVSFNIYELRQYMDFFLPNKDGDNGFHLAVIHNQPDVLDKLLFIMSKDKNLRPIIDEQNGLYQTALHLATHLQQVEIMRKLLIAGASINITDHKGNTPLHIAAKFSSSRPLEEIIRYISIQTILEVVHVRNNEGQSCIHVAAKNGNTEILRKLRDLGVDIDVQDFNSGKTALHLVIENNSLADVQFLLETCEADVNSLTYSGCSPLHIAAGRGDVSIVAYLISMGADPELVTDEGDLALDLAGSEQVMSFLTKVSALKWLY